MSDEQRNDRSPQFGEGANAVPLTPPTAFASESAPTLPAPSGPTDKTRPLPRPEDYEHVPGMLGTYRLEEEIGRGGMGMVYRAFDEQLERTVAIKLISPDYITSWQSVARLKSEAKSAAKLSHPRIVAIYAFGFEQGWPYIAMEFVRGNDLGKVVRMAGKLEPSRAVRYIRQSAEALAFAARNNVVHRDIKPTNLFLTDDDFIKVMDFGLAKQLDEEAALTATGARLGTPNYMSPEQGRGEKVDSRSDMYSLGCTLYTLIAGTVPFMTTTPIEAIIKHATEQLKFPPDWHLIADGKLVDVLKKLTEKNPDDRYTDWDVAVAELKELEAVLGRPEPVKKPANRKLIYAIVAILLLLVFGALGFGAYSIFGGSNETPAANTTAPVEPMTSAKEQREKQLAMGEQGSSIDASAYALSTGADAPAISGAEEVSNSLRNPMAESALSPQIQSQASPLNPNSDALRNLQDNTLVALARGNWLNAAQGIQAIETKLPAGKRDHVSNVLVDARSLVQFAGQFERQTLGLANHPVSPEIRMEKAEKLIETEGRSMQFETAFDTLIYLKLMDYANADVYFDSLTTKFGAASPDAERAELKRIVDDLQDIYTEKNIAGKIQQGGQRPPAMMAPGQMRPFGPPPGNRRQ